MENEDLKRNFDLSPDEDAPEMPEECPESEAAIEELSRRSLEGKFNFINVIVLSVLLIACASFFISMTSSKRYGDEGNKFTAERLVNGKYTAEISRRYYSTIAYPDEITSVSETIARFYGYNPKGNKSVTDPEPIKEETGPRVTRTIIPTHDEDKVTSATGDGGGEGGEDNTDTETTTTTIYETVFSRTVSTTAENPWADYFTTTTTVTTVNTEEPGATATTTADTSVPEEDSSIDESQPDESSEESSSKADTSKASSSSEPDSSKDESSSSAPDDDSSTADDSQDSSDASTEDSSDAAED